MSDPKVLAFPLPDAGARRRIHEDLDTNLLVEAGAGSGKTTELVNRMVALVATGAATVDEIAAVTFTRKAAAELRERFQARLERDIRSDGVADDVAGRLRQALEDIDRAFLGTIHAFCARLLREHPLEVGLDPAFQELKAEERTGFYLRFWEGYLERLARESAPMLDALGAAGLGTAQLYGMFAELAANPDVEFPLEETSPPAGGEVTSARRELESLVRTGMELMPERTPDQGWDPLQKKLRTAAFTLEVTGWKNPADFFEGLALLCKDGPRGHEITLNRWRNAELAKELRRRVNAFGVGDAPARRLLDRWYAHRYALALRLAQGAASEFAEHRRRSGRLDFQDLLLLTARLLRTDAGARLELGRRYRRLVVDEFQDTDPLQAEIVLLLASEPGDGGGATWRSAVPRPGALFVVGDPKQSIYRFRRADIQLYEFVKGRFADFGSVVELTSNFRSRAPIGDLVNQVFDDPAFFPAQASAGQARFEPLNTRPSPEPAPAEGVFWYALSPGRDTVGEVAADDAARVAAWIRRRVDEGERSPGEFLVLTRVTTRLSFYARALEAHGLPVQVTGAGVGVEEELGELLALLGCMIDPTDPVKVVAVLVGLFFGLDHGQLLEHRLGGGDVEVIKRPSGGHPAVRGALETLHGWWRSASREPADVFLGRLVPELGLLPLAAAGELGSIRAGALVYAMDAVRGAALAGDASLPGALRALQAALAGKDAEAPLEPGRSDVVRLMNLHQAKGLEAPVVVLADPSAKAPKGRDIHVERRDDGSAVGYLRVVAERGGEGKRGARLLARPSDWPAMEEAEARFEDAEEVRLLYVAATRARDELVVAHWPGKPDASPWAPLDAWAREHGEELELEAWSPLPREELLLSPEELAERLEAARSGLAARAEPSFRHVSVTDLAKHDRAGGASRLPGEGGAGVGADESVAGAFRGYSWGSAVHGALAAAATDDSEVGLRAACRALLVEHARPLDDHGQPRELEELVALVRAVRGSDLWRRAAAASRVLAEVPFAVPGVTRPPPPHAPEPEQDGTPRRRAMRQLDLFGGAAHGTPAEPEVAGGGEEDEPLPSILEGVVDLAFREKGGWVIADYKTDVGTDPDFPARVEAYRRQVDLYAEAWTRLTGEPVKERVLFFIAQGRTEAW
jgi:ATP-dependent helicase/nuclease subunit A